jgi:hypothetical protein
VAVRAFIQEEDAIAAMTAALARQGKASDDNIRALKEYAAELQRSTTIGDEAALAAMAMAMNLGVSQDRIQEVTTAAVGLSRIIKKDLNTAMMLMARASKGQTQMLSRYGLTLDETMSPQEKFNALLKIGAANFSLAEAEAATMGGRLAQARNSFGDLIETFGGAIVRGLQLTERFRRLAKSLDEINQRLAGGNELEKWAAGANTALEVTGSLIRDIFAGGELRSQAFSDLGSIVKAAFSDAAEAMISVLIRSASFIGQLIGDGVKQAAADTIGLGREAEAAFEAKAGPLERSIMTKQQREDAIDQERRRIKASRAEAAGRGGLDAAIGAGLLNGESRLGATLRAIAEARGVGGPLEGPARVPGSGPVVADVASGTTAAVSTAMQQIGLGRVFEIANTQRGRTDPSVQKLTEVKEELTAVKNTLQSVFRAAEEGA